MQVKIYINSQLCDFFDAKDFPLTLTRRAIDYSNPTERKGENTYTVKFPATSQNKRIFEVQGEQAERNKFRTERRYSCQIYSGDIKLLDGQFFLTKLNRNEYQGFIVGGGSTFGNEIEGKTLRDLQFEPFDFIGWQTMQDHLQELYADWQANSDINDYSRAITWGLCIYSSWFLANKWSRGTYICSDDYYAAIPGVDPKALTVNIPSPLTIFGQDTYRLDIASAPHIDFRDVPPQFFIREILRQIFADAGYALRGKFLDSSICRKLVMPFTNDRPVIYNWEFLANSEYRSYLDVNNPPNFDLHVKLRFERDINPPFNIFFYEDIGLYDTVYQNTDITGFPIIFDRWYTYVLTLSYQYKIKDYAFSLGHSHVIRAGNGEPTETVWTAPTTAEYKFTLVVYVANGTIVNSPTFKQAIGLSKISGQGGDVNLDGEYTQTGVLAQNNANSVLAAAQVTGISTYETLETGWVKLDEGTAVTSWIATSMYYHNPTNGDDLGFNVWTLPYPPDFDETNPNQTWIMESSLQVNRVELLVECRNLPDTPPADQFGTQFKIGQNLPNVSQKEFLKSIFALFNLYLDINPTTRVATLNSFEDFYLPTATAHDITSISRGQEFDTLPPSLPELVNFKWNKDNDFLSAINGADYDVKFETGIGNAASSSEIASGTFHSTEFRDYYLVAQDKVNATAFATPAYEIWNTLELPTMISEANYNKAQNELSTAEYNWKPRIFIIDEVKQFATPISPVRIFDNTQLPLSRDRYENLFTHVQFKFNEIKLSAFPQLTLNFKTNFGLFALYYEALFMRLVSGHEVELEALLSGWDYDQMQANRPILHAGNVYYLKEISNFSPFAKKATRLKLVKA